MKIGFVWTQKASCHFHFLTEFEAKFFRDYKAIVKLKKNVRCIIKNRAQNRFVELWNVKWNKYHRRIQVSICIRWWCKSWLHANWLRRAEWRIRQQAIKIGCRADPNAKQDNDRAVVEGTSKLPDVAFYFFLNNRLSWNSENPVLNWAYKRSPFWEKVKSEIARYYQIWGCSRNFSPTKLLVFKAFWKNKQVK